MLQEPTGEAEVQPRARWQTVKWLGCAALGALVGAAIALSLSHRAKPRKALASQPFEAPAAPQQRALVVPPTNALDRAQLAALQQRVQQLEQHDSPAAATDEAPASSAEVHRELARLVAQHRADAVDRPWAATTLQLFSKDLATAAAPSGASVLAFDCRTSSCDGRVEWNSRQQAIKSYAELIHTSFRANCEKTILLDDEPAANGKWQASLYFDCAGWRAEGSVPLDG